MGKTKNRSRSNSSNYPDFLGRSPQKRSKRSRDKNRKRRHERKYSPSSSSKSSSDLHSSEPSQERAETTTEGQKLYQERKKLRKLEEEKTTAAILQGMEGELKLRKVELSDFQNYKRKLVILNIPTDVAKEELNDYFYTVLQS